MTNATNEDPPRKDGRDAKALRLIAALVCEDEKGSRAFLGGSLVRHLDTLAQPAVDVDALRKTARLAENIYAIFGLQKENLSTPLQARLVELQDSAREALRAHLAPAPGVVEALDAVCNGKLGTGSIPLPPVLEEPRLWTLITGESFAKAVVALAEFHQAQGTPDAQRPA